MAVAHHILVKKWYILRVTKLTTYLPAESVSAKIATLTLTKVSKDQYILTRVHSDHHPK